MKTGSRKVVDDSDEEEDAAPVKPSTAKAKPKSQPYVNKKFKAPCVLGN